MSEETTMLGIDLAKQGAEVSRIGLDYDLYQRLKADAAIGKALLSRIGQPAIDALMSGFDKAAVVPLSLKPSPSVRCIEIRYYGRIGVVDIELDRVRLDKPQKQEG